MSIAVESFKEWLRIASKSLFLLLLKKFWEAMTKWYLINMALSCSVLYLRMAKDVIENSWSTKSCKIWARCLLIEMEASSSKIASKWSEMINLVACNIVWFKYFKIFWKLRWAKMALFNLKAQKYFLIRFLLANLEIMLYKQLMKNRTRTKKN